MSLSSIDSPSEKVGTAVRPLPPDTTSYLDLAKGLIDREPGVYVLKMQGTAATVSVSGDGDVLVLRQQTHADEGDLVQAWLSKERRSIVSRIYYIGDTVCLKSEDPAIRTRYLARKDIRIQGKVLFIMRRPQLREVA